MNSLKQQDFYDIGLNFYVNNDIPTYRNHVAKCRNLLISEQNKLNLLGTDFIAYRFLFIDNDTDYTEYQLQEYLLVESTKFSCKNIVITNKQGNDSFILITEITGN